jgi:hypothetical protein
MSFMRLGLTMLLQVRTIESPKTFGGGNPILAYSAMHRFKRHLVI